MREKQIISDNATGTDTSFVGILHEKGIWDTHAFLNLFDAFNGLASKLSADLPIDRELATQISKVNSFILNSVIYHLDPDDSFKIQNLNSTSIRDYLERLNLVVDGVFHGKPTKEEIFDDELRKGGG